MDLGGIFLAVARSEETCETSLLQARPSNHSGHGSHNAPCLSFIHIPKTGGGFEDPLKKPSLRVLKGGKAPQQVLITGMNALVSWSRTWFRRCLSCIVYQEL